MQEGIEITNANDSMTVDADPASGESSRTTSLFLTRCFSERLLARLVTPKDETAQNLERQRLNGQSARKVSWTAELA